MQQVRAVRPHHATAPPTGPAAHELSREEREQLRVVRHHAFQRHQRNAVWMRELLQNQVGGSVGTLVIGGEAGGDHTQPNELDVLRKQLTEQQQELEAEQQRHSDLLRTLRTIDSDETLAACRARVVEETSRYAIATRKEPKVIRL